MKRENSDLRLIPIHLDLLEIGFLTGLLIKRLKEDPGDLLCRSILDGFEELVAAVYEGKPDAPTKKHR